MDAHAAVRVAVVLVLSGAQQPFGHGLSERETWATAGYQVFSRNLSSFPIKLVGYFKFIIRPKKLHVIFIYYFPLMFIEL